MRIRVWRVRGKYPSEFLLSLSVYFVGLGPGYGTRMATQPTIPRTLPVFSLEGKNCISETVEMPILTHVTLAANIVQSQGMLHTLR